MTPYRAPPARHLRRERPCILVSLLARIERTGMKWPYRPIVQGIGILGVLACLGAGAGAAAIFGSFAASMVAGMALAMVLLMVAGALPLVRGWLRVRRMLRGVRRARLRVVVPPVPARLGGTIDGGEEGESAGEEELEEGESGAWTGERPRGGQRA